MNELPFLDPYACNHRIAKVLSDKVVKGVGFSVHEVKFRCALCGAIVETELLVPDTNPES